MPHSARVAHCDEADGRLVGVMWRHGFEQVTPGEKTRVLRMYSTIPERQVEASVVLAWDR